MKTLKYNLLENTFKNINELDFITITDKEGNPIDFNTEQKLKEILTKYWDNPKIKELFGKMFLNYVIYGSEVYDLSEIDKVLNEIIRKELEKEAFN